MTKCALSLIEVERRRRAVSGDHKVDRTIVVDVTDCGALCLAVSFKSRFPGPLSERAISVVAPEDVRRAAGRQRLTRDEQIEVAVMVEIHEGQPGRLVHSVNAYLVR